MIRDSFNNASDFVLNMLQVEYDNLSVNGELLSYSTSEHLRSLQDRNQGKWICKRAGRRIQAVPLTIDAQTLSGEPVTFSATTDWTLFGKLLEEGVRRTLKTLYPSCVVSNYGEVLLKVTGKGADLAEEVLRNLRMQKPSFLSVYKVYHFEAAYLRANASEQPEFGLRVKLSTNWRIRLSIQELDQLGIDLTGCYVVPIHPTRVDEIGNRAVGALREVDAGKVYLNDARGVDLIDANEYTVEASLENVNKCFEKILGTQSTYAIKSLRSTVSHFLGAVEQQKRIAEIGRALANQPFTCAHNLTARIYSELQRANTQTRCSPVLFEEPKYVLKYGGPSISGPIATALDAQGPFDRDSFRKTNPFILVLTPKQYLGQVEQFLGKWRDGGLRLPYSKGFIKKYTLRGCEFHFEDFEVSTNGLASDYEMACLQALQKSRERIKRFDLAFIVTSEKHRFLGENDPYLIAKSTLMGNGIATQAVEIETINTSSDNWPFILNNLALASYAKLGGTPWTLASPKGQGITHEVILGLGSATVGSTRLAQKERYVGIATLFNYDGVYLLSKTSQESTLDDYPKALESALVSGLERIQFRKGWRQGDRVRLVFHTFKPLKNIEVEVVKSLVKNKLNQFSVDFAFLVLGNEHNWMMFDPASPGFTTRGGSVRGVQIPRRGSSVILNENEFLVSMTGPKEVKFTDQGVPAPLRIYLNGASTFRDLKYLGEQVLNFSYMSWKTFSLSSLPITISYGDMIARLLGRLRHIRNWNANALETTELSESLWFL
ncbi:MAG: hypothetical protein HY327_04235 [Chloroflexi bacterium]|nr:hypothetical protein [Chloroflexota bacterium]